MLRIVVRGGWFFLCVVPDGGWRGVRILELDVLIGIWFMTRIESRRKIANDITRRSEMTGGVVDSDVLKEAKDTEADMI